MESGKIEKAEEWPELIAFACAMRARLEEKAPERGGKSWKDASLPRLLNEICRHYGMLYEGIARSDETEIKKKAIDVANLAMMIYDMAAAPIFLVDPVEEFIRENCIPEPGREVLASIVYKRFVVWYHSNVGRSEPSRTWFNKQFSKKFASKPYDKSTVFLGVSLVRACRVCGCTEENACTGGCSWVDDPEGGDLCSRCAG